MILPLTAEEEPALIVRWGWEAEVTWMVPDLQEALLNVDSSILETIQLEEYDLFSSPKKTKDPNQSAGGPNHFHSLWSSTVEKFSRFYFELRHFF